MTASKSRVTADSHADSDRNKSRKVMVINTVIL